MIRSALAVVVIATLLFGGCPLARAQTTGSAALPQSVSEALALQQKGTPDAMEAAFHGLEALSEKGDVAASRELGLCWLYGTGTSQDKVKGAQLISRASGKGDVPSTYWKGVCQLGGHGLQRDPAAALRSFEAAAKGGHKEAKYQAAKMLWFGNGIEKDERRAFELMKDLADVNHIGALSSLSLMYAFGEGVPKSDDQSLAYALRAAELGDVRQMEMVGMMYLDDEKPFHSDAKAADWFSKASQAGSPLGTAFLARCYYFGWGRKQDLTVAFELNKRAAAKGNALAMHQIGCAMIRGKGTEKSVANGMDWLRKAEAAGFEPSKKLLAEIRAAQASAKSSGPSWESIAESALKTAAAAAIIYVGAKSMFSDEGAPHTLSGAVCPRCGGAGQVVRPSPVTGMERNEQCGVCGGSGHL